VTRAVAGILLALQKKSLREPTKDNRRGSPIPVVANFVTLVNNDGTGKVAATLQIS